MALISAWELTSLSEITVLRPFPKIFSPFTTTAPTGTSSKSNDSLAKSTYFKNKDIFEDKKQLIFESKPKFKSKMLDEDQLKDLEK